jgi:hypothetical protein
MVFFRFEWVIKNVGTDLLLYQVEGGRMAAAF